VLRVEFRFAHERKRRSGNEEIATSERLVPWRWFDLEMDAPFTDSDQSIGIGHLDAHQPGLLWRVHNAGSSKPDLLRGTSAGGDSVDDPSEPL